MFKTRSIRWIVAVMAAAALMLPAMALAQGGISVTALDAGTFITVKETAQGDLVSLYRVSGGRIVLVDTVINSSKHSSMSLNIPKRFLYHVELEND